MQFAMFQKKNDKYISKHKKILQKEISFLFVLFVCFRFLIWEKEVFKEEFFFFCLFVSFLEKDSISQTEEKRKSEKKKKVTNLGQDN